MLEQLILHRRALHKIPEIMFELPKTRAYILNAFKHSRAQVEVTEKGGPFTWLTARRIEEEAALPTAFRQFWEEENNV